MKPRPPTYGLMAEFRSPEELLAATRRARDDGYRKMDAYSPFPIDEVGDALESRGSGISMLTLLGGVIGGVGGFAMQYYVSVISYPLDIGGRPTNSWPAFIPVTFEMTILFAALFAVFGMLAMNGLPMPYHPVFNVPRFSRASQDRFFLVIESTDPFFDDRETRRFLESLGAREVTDVAY